MQEIGAHRPESGEGIAVPHGAAARPKWTGEALAAAGRGVAFLVAGLIAAVILVFEVRLGLLHEDGRGDRLQTFIAQNDVQLDWRLNTLRLTGGLTGLAGLVIVGLCFWKGARLAASLEKWGRLCLPLLPLVILPPLLVRSLWTGNELQLLLLAGLFGLTFEAALRRALLVAGGPIDRLAARVPDKAATWVSCVVVFSAVAYYAVRISLLTCQNHDRLGTSISDLGEFDNLFYNALHGHPFRAPGIDGDVRDWGALKVHAEFVLYLLLPFYAIRPGPQALLVIQSTVVALTAIPLFFFTARRAGRTAGVLVAITFLHLPFVQRPNFYDFHFVPVGMLFVACTICFLERCGVTDSPSRKVRVFLWVSFVLALLSREDIAAGMAVVGIFAALSGHAPRIGFIMTGAAAAYFVLIKFVVMAKIGPSWFDSIYEDLKVPGQRGFTAVVNTLISNPVFTVRKLLTEQKFLYALHLTVPLLFLWLRSWPLLVAALPGFFFTMAVTNRPPMSESSFQYAYLWAPHVVAASALSLQRLGSTPFFGVAARRAAMVALPVVALAVSMHQGALLGAPAIRGGFSDKVLSLTDSERIRADQLREIVKSIPKDASVVATEMVGAHVSSRLLFYSLKVGMGDKPDYILVGYPWIQEERRRIREALASGYGVVKHLGPFYLVKRGAPTTDNAALENEVR